MRNSASIIALFFVFVAGAPNVRADTIVPDAFYVLQADGAPQQDGDFTGNFTLSASQTTFYANGDRLGQMSDRASISSTSAAANAQATAYTSSEVDAGASASITYYLTVEQLKQTAVRSVLLDLKGSVSFASSAASGGFNFAAASIELFDNSTNTTVARIVGNSNCLIGECTAPSGAAEEEETPPVGVGDSLHFTLLAHCAVSTFSGDGTCSALADPAVTIDPRSPDAADFGLEFSSNLPQEAPAAQVPEPPAFAFVLFGFGLVLAMKER
jgi:hypothetical protein